MKDLLTPETFEFFATYLLAGYIVIIVRSRFVLGLQPKPAELVVEAVIFSLIIQLFVSVTANLFSWLAPEGILLWFTAKPEFLFLLKILLAPTLLGILLGYNLTAGWKNAMLRRLSLPVVHPVQRAHDFAFGKDREAGFVIVTYFDGTVVSGYFGEASLAATDGNRSDLYLERLYTVGDDDVWTEPAPKRSGLISLNNVRSIEFLDNQERTS